MNIGEAKEIVGSLSFPTKMPGTAFGLPATACKIGSKLAKVPGTVCNGCYALKGRYGTGNVTKAHQQRLAGLQHPRWADAMVVLLEHYHREPTFRVDMGVRNAKARGVERFKWNESGWHRWHDSGDLQSMAHLSAICEIAARLPWIRFWLPTLEVQMIHAWVAEYGAIPDNLTVRLSSPKLDHPIKDLTRTRSMVFSDPASVPPDAHRCPAPQQDHQCGSCRACWDRSVPLVAYARH